jgi:acyl dehydratase
MLSVDPTRVGERSAPVSTEVEKGAIRRLAEALGETNPIYFEESAARQAGYRHVVAPPTFPMTLAPASVPGLRLPAAGVLHGEQRFVYGEPICAGDVIAVRAWLEDVKARKGQRGTMTVLGVASEGVNQWGQMVFQAHATLIVTEVTEGAG